MRAYLIGFWKRCRFVVEAGDDRTVVAIRNLIFFRQNLAGVLNTLYELHLPILAVQKLDSE